MSSSQEISEIFYVEAEKLESDINDALIKSHWSVSEIVSIYYRTMNVNSIVYMLKQLSDSSSEASSVTFKIEEVKKTISEKFDSNLHLSIMKQLADSIAETTKKLSSGNDMEKSKEDIETEAKLYEELRQTMSTKEFVEQYDKGLSNA
ncbi:MAG: hypothetical protein ACR2LL_02545 [Nitrosopumilus sp.]